MKLQKVTNIWKMRNLLLLRKITVTNVLTSTIELLNKIQKHDNLCNDYENGGLKSVDIFSKIVSLQCSWIKRLDDENFHP